MNPGEGHRPDRKKVQDYIDLLTAFRDGGTIETSGFTVSGQVVSGPWKRAERLCMDLTEPAFMEYQYRVVE